MAVCSSSHCASLVLELHLLTRPLLHGCGEGQGHLRAAAAIIRGVPPHWVNEPHQELAPALMVVVAGSFMPPTPPRAPPSQVAGLTSSQLRVWWDLLIGFNFSTSFLSSLPAVVLFLLLHLRLHHHHHPSVHHVLSVLVHPHRSL